MCFVSWLIWQLIDDPFMADLLFSVGFIITIPLTIWAIVVFLMSIWMNGRVWKFYFIWGCAIIILLGAYYISPTRFGTVCNPDIMADHYEQNKIGIHHLVEYTNQSMDEGAQMNIEFEDDVLRIRYILGKNDSIVSNFWTVSSDNKSESLMQVVGLDSEELDNIRRKLKKLGCISIEAKTTHSDYVDIGFRRVGLGMVFYRIYNRPLNDKEKKKYLEDTRFTLYNDTVLFKYEGGADS